MPDGFSYVRPLRLTDRLALTSYDIRWDDDGQEDAVIGIWPMLRQWMVDAVGFAVHDFGTSVNVICDDHPRIRKLLRRPDRFAS